MGEEVGAQPKAIDARALVEALGGPKLLAAKLGVRSAAAVCNWYNSGIPARHHLPLWRLAQQAGVDWRPPGAEGLILPAPGAAASQDVHQTFMGGPVQEKSAA